MNNIQELCWCDTRDEHGCLFHAPGGDQRNSFMVLGKKQKTNSGSKPKLQDHYRCTITCTFCGNRKQYEDKCYHKQRLSARLKKENGSGKGSRKGNADQDSGKRKSEGRGKGQEKDKGGPGGSDRKPDKDKNADKSGGNRNPTPGENSDPSGGQPNLGPTTHSPTQAQQEQGTKRANEDGDEFNAHNRSCFMHMAPKLRERGFEVTCPAEF